LDFQSLAQSESGQDLGQFAVLTVTEILEHLLGSGVGHLRPFPEQFVGIRHTVKVRALLVSDDGLKRIEAAVVESVLFRPAGLTCLRVCFSV